MLAAVEAILDRSEARARALIADMPDGTYSFDDYMDDVGPGTDPVLVAVDVTIAGSEATVDFGRSSGQVKAGINCYINYTRAYAMFAMRIFAKVDVPHNDGVERAIHVAAPEGSFFNARYPAASGGRATVQVRIFDAVNGALAKAAPERAMGAFSHWANPNIGGIDATTGKRWVMYDLVFGGFGGRAGSDGPDGLCPVFNCANVPVEVHESVNPILVHRLEFITNSGGAGQFRGGCGMRKDVEILGDGAIVTLLGDRHRFPAYGLFGGGAGALASTRLLRDGAVEDLGSKEVRQLRRGDVISFCTSGAGGYGPVEDRDPAAIQSDIANGFVSA
jgi:N-methylhydantoinase B